MRYEAVPRQLGIVDVATGEGAGWVGYWPREWREQDVYGIGWSALPTFQGRGIAGAATRAALDAARDERDRRFVLAYLAVDNGPSNGICREVGCALLGSHESSGRGLRS